MYFAGVLNAVLVSGLSEVDPGDAGYGWICGAIEQSFVFFKNCETSLRQADLSTLTQNGGEALAHEVLNDIAPVVRNVLMAQGQRDSS
jgi:hypothetical protein